MYQRFHTLLFLLLLPFLGLAQTSSFTSRTAHISVQSANSFVDIDADNYQVYSTLDATTGEINFIGLLKSFEFKLGALDRVYNSKLVGVLEKPKFNYTGKIKNIKSINLKKPGKYPFEVEGDLFVWDEKRVTPGKGTITVHEDGRIEAFSDISFMIEKASVEKANRLIKQYMPNGVQVDTEKLGIDRKIETMVKVIYK